MSELFRLQPNLAIETKYAQNIDDIAIASVTWHELLYGFHRLPTSRKKEESGFFLRQIIRPNVSILDYGEVEAEWFAIERARLAGTGRMPSYADGQIAAVAAVHNLILVTRNISDYSNFSGLAIENWFE
ncbi:type II toxin-antitoxin system VapC family toxin [Phormidesmis sp. 146-12]